MRAAYITEFASWETVVQTGELPKPTPAAGEVLIRVRSAGVNPIDWKICKGPLTSMFPHHFPLILGWDAAGVVEQLGAGVDAQWNGAEVFCCTIKSEVQHGAFAEYVTVPVASLAHKPRSLDFDHAAAVPLAAHTAYQGLHEQVKIRTGETCLVSAAAGGVGQFAVQFARAAGARVIALASARNHAWLKEIGAQHCIDYTTANVAEAVRALRPEGVDTAFIASGADSVDGIVGSLRPQGRVVSVSARIKPEDVERLKLDSTSLFIRPDGAQLTKIAEMIDAGQVKVDVQKTYPLEQVKDAFAASATVHTRGKLVLRISE